jgi:hypothetical protein
MKATETPRAKAPSHCCFVHERSCGRVKANKITAPKKKRHALVDEGPI